MKESSSKSNKLFDVGDLLFIWKLISRNFLLIILLPMATFLFAKVYTYRLTDIYGAKSQVLLKSNETYDYQDPIYKGLGAYGMYMDVRNQIRILQSKDLIGEVVDKMSIDISYYVNGRIKQKEVYETLPITADIEVINYNIYETPIKVNITSKDSYEINYLNGITDKKIEGNFNDKIISEDFILKLDRSYNFNDGNIDRIMSSEYEFVIHTRSNLISKYQRSLYVENIEHTSILEISLTDHIGQRAKDFLDTLTAVFADFSMRTQEEVNTNTLDNIEKQIGEVLKIINDIEINLLNYKSNKNILNLTREEDEYFSKYVEYSKKSRELENKLSSVLSLEEYILTSTDEHILPPSFYILQNDFYLQKTISQIYELQLSLSQSSSSISPDNPNYIKKQSQLNNLKKDILVYIGNLKTALESEKVEVNSFVKMYEGKIKNVPKSAQGLENITRELEVNNKMYLFLLEKKTNTLIARAGIIPQVQVIEEAHQMGVIGPEKDRIMTLWTLSGLIIALLIAVVRKLFFETIESVDELAEVTDHSVVAGVPLIKNINSDIVVTDMPKSNVSESFRTLRTNISYLRSSDEQSTTILISSFFPGEGKTFCSTNLSVILARSQKKVLVLDFDLHKPKIHKTFGLENNQGVSDYVVGSEKPESFINKYDDYLDIITAGTIPPNPSELILRDKVTELINWAKSKYDYVLLDTPPFGLLNDSIELTKYADTFLVVLNRQYSKKRGIKHIDSILEKIPETNKGLILNGIVQKRFRYYYNKYTYKYGYNYGYGYGYRYGSGYGYEYGDNENK
ncbi:MAG: polysaccharide biosynthesis tyrosine autokinase [Crocinitomicaceae bacterium]|nr:polysaccharide biosynthesis tyrosine autokinase [Crocinitomicaceae bacterium]